MNSDLLAKVALFKDLAPSDSPLFLWLPSSKQEATDPRLGSAETSSG
jgi:hypothetical protein